MSPKLLGHSLAVLILALMARNSLTPSDDGASLKKSFVGASTTEALAPVATQFNGDITPKPTIQVDRIAASRPRRRLNGSGTTSVFAGLEPLPDIAARLGHPIPEDPIALLHGNIDDDMIGRWNADQKRFREMSEPELVAHWDIDSQAYPAVYRHAAGTEVHSFREWLESDYHIENASRELAQQIGSNQTLKKHKNFDPVKYHHVITGLEASYVEAAYVHEIFRRRHLASKDDQMLKRAPWSSIPWKSFSALTESHPRPQWGDKGNINTENGSLAAVLMLYDNKREDILTSGEMTKDDLPTQADQPFRRFFAQAVLNAAHREFPNSKINWEGVEHLIDDHGQRPRAKEMRSSRKTRKIF